MTIQEIKPFIENEPFQPFSIRLSNGATYEFKERWNLGAPKKPSHAIIYFGETEFILIGINNIVQISNGAK